MLMTTSNDVSGKVELLCVADRERQRRVRGALAGASRMFSSLEIDAEVTLWLERAAHEVRAAAAAAADLEHVAARERRVANGVLVEP